MTGHLRCPRCGARHRIQHEGTGARFVPNCDIKKWRRMKHGN
jgi:hypothetical protein